MKLTIAKIPLSEFTVVSHGYSDAADVLVKYISLATGVELPVECTSLKDRHEIRLGAPDDVCKGLKLDGIKNDGFVLKEALGNFIIRSNTETGVLNGVYEFLHRIIGWRFLSPGIETLHSPDEDIDIAEGYTYSHNPVYEYRQVDWVSTHNEDWRKKNHINFTDFHWQHFVHTLAFFAETNDPVGQPCLSDEEVFNKVVKNVRKVLDEHPECKIVSVSQNDNQNYCKCEKCAAVDAEEGSHAGTLIRFVNRVADALKDDYPDVSIDTLAYQYTRKAPLITKPRDNVIIRLCSIECCFSHGLNDPDCEVNAAFKHDIIEWGKISKRLYIWDYVTDFSYYIPPFPNWRVLKDNLQFFADNHAVGMYPEGNYNSVSGEFGELRGYLLARAMWDPYMSDEELDSYKKDFLRGYYGNGWEGIEKFIDFTLEKSHGRHFNIWTHPFDLIPREDYAAHEKEIDGWWASAYDKADDEQKTRVDRSSMQWDAVKLYLHPNEEDGRRFYEKMKKYSVNWNEWNPLSKMKADIDFATTPNEWIK
jgi:hypothetical protein